MDSSGKNSLVNSLVACGQLSNGQNSGYAKIHVRKREKEREKEKEREREEENCGIVFDACSTKQDYT